MMDRYDLNDALEGIAARWGVNPDEFRDDDHYDEWLDGLTHYVADALDEYKA